MRLSSPPRVSAPHILVCSVLVLVLGGCFIFRGVDIESVSTVGGPDPVTVESAVKAHLVDGSTVLYPNGVRIAGDTVRGTGTRWDLALEDSEPVLAIPLDSVLAMEAFRTNVDEAKTVGISLLATVGVTATVVAIACAADPKCFGSCPTFYSDAEGESTLEAEGFSYAIAPLLETRDVDRLGASVDTDGRLRLEVRNEALETHYLNHIALLDVRHEPDEMALPDRLRNPIAVRNLRAFREVRDRDGRDQSHVVAVHDGAVFQTSPSRLAAVKRGDFVDWLDIEIPVTPDADSVALVFRMRNSLLTTVLLYDLMLGDRGAYALNWLSRDLAQPMPIIELGTWAVEHLGLRVMIPTEEGWEVVGRFGDAGPVAWKDVAVIVPITERPHQPVRIEFVADNWRIDRLAYSGEWRRPEAAVVPLADAIAPGGHSIPEIVDLLGTPDADYLRTSMGERFTSVFEPEPLGGDRARTFFLVSQGWYSEWIRRAWLEEGTERTAFRPTTASILQALERWRESKDSTEQHFYATRVPVR